MEEILRRTFMNKVDPRRAKERKDFLTVNEDPNAMANLPEAFIHREWQKDSPHPSPWFDDVVYSDKFGF